MEEGLDERELAIFDLLKRENLAKTDRERVKQASKLLLASVRKLIAPMEHWTRTSQTQAEVRTSLLDWLYQALPMPPFTEDETNQLANHLYEYVWEQSEAGTLSS